MPETLAIGIFVLGAVMLLLALVSGSFKIFGSEMPGVSSRTARVIAFVIGAGLVGFSLYHFQFEGDHGPKPASAPAPGAPSQDQPTPVPAAPAPGAGAKPATPEPPTRIREDLNDAASARLYGREGMDFGVPPRNTIQENVGTFTPLTIPGVQTITTGELAADLRRNRVFLLVDVLDAPHQGLPGARRYPGVGMPEASADLLQLLEKDTHGDKAYPVVFYCQGPACWESYNAALRARDGGYTNIYWYRGGLESWAMAGLPGG
jgi:PQQ-dependent catabolism-associated CXXCW motif protein